VKVGVRAYGSIRDIVGTKRPGDLVEIEIPTGSEVAAVAEKLGVPPGMIFMILLDGEPCEPTDKVHDRAEVTLMPPFSGG
jgi:molybdopterin converting factor small subunit